MKIGKIPKCIPKLWILMIVAFRLSAKVATFWVLPSFLNIKIKKNFPVKKHSEQRKRRIKKYLNYKSISYKNMSFNSFK